MTSLKLALFAGAALALPLAAAPLAADEPAAVDAASGNPEIVVTAKPLIGEFGVDLTARDLTVKPGDDFEKYASGSWIAKTEIPSDRPNTGSFTDLRETVQAEVQELITKAPAGSKYGRLYRGYMDEKAVEKAGIAPLMADVARVRAIRDHTEFARFMGSTYDKFGMTLFAGGPYADPDDPTMNTLWFGQAGIGLPEKDYYFNDKFAKQRIAYRDYIERTMKTLGDPNPAAAASEIMAFETYVAALSWDSAPRRDITKINNPMSTAELAAYAPGIDWAAYFAGANVPEQKRIIVNENTAVRDLAALYAKTPLETLKRWQAFHVADQAAGFLPKRIVDSKFAFTSTLSGVSDQRPRWKRAVDMVNGSLGEMVGQSYVAEFFPPIAKMRMDELVKNL